MTIWKAILSVCLLAVPVVSMAGALEYSSPQQTALSDLKKLRALKPVLLDTYYRAGGPGGRVPLPEDSLQSLCRVGFSSAFYLYNEGMKGTKTVNCVTHDGRANQLTYTATSDYRGSKYAVLAEIYHLITENRGPVLAHCWNGWHASGEIAAYALIQFCDWNGEDAAEYWAQNIGDQGNLPKYGSIKRRIATFQPRADLKIPADVKAHICPNKY